MEEFKNIIGNEDAKAYFLKTLDKNKLSHSYIFEGPYGVGKNTFAMELTKYILCENKKENIPCGTCPSCHMIQANTHPDVITIEKDTKVTKIENIRHNIIREMDTKPYHSKYKIVIVKAADSITIEGQNAMLKTIEEPPKYGIIILVCENTAKLLPTIKSRCITIRFNPLNREDLAAYLNLKNIQGTRRELLSKLSHGSIGVINDILEDDQYLELRKQSIFYLERLDKADLIGVYDLVKELTDQKDLIERILEFWLLWYRDIAVVKKTGTSDLYYIDQEKHLLDMAYKLTYNKVSNNIDNIKTALLDIKQNIYNTFVIENLLLKLKERKK
ncbi:DNA polymerase III subunit delta' [Cellulosilyticum sp. I15G10I2]|uniref:DNA polymerase III subunit delta' n=1 Tax=Cellulosilyticum sp. I15G10I2 TaxID=1892843 RepID=UPI00085CCC83|nr:DNA polymerase III subunit delta' [Cellulosilyticum sp. I15G10I2]